MNVASAPVVQNEKQSLQEVFPEQCLKATPDPEFLSNLYVFDMSLCPHRAARKTHISEIFMEKFDAINSASRVPELIIWMKSQKHPDQRKNLFRYHRQSIEFWLYEELFKTQVYLHSNNETFLLLLASATLVDFPQFCDIHHLIPRALDILSPMYRTERDHYHQIEDSNKWEIYVKYRKFVSRFLIDLTRSETRIPLQVDPRYSAHSSFIWWARECQDHYVSLAKHLLSFLSKGLRKIEKYEVNIPKAVLIFLPIVFSQARRSAATLDLLKAGSIRFDPQLRSRFPQENWDQLFSSSYEACKLAIAAEGDKPTIPEADGEFGTSSWGCCCGIRI